jgi:hypothetical protein
MKRTLLWMAIPNTGFSLAHRPKETKSPAKALNMREIGSLAGKEDRL